jgi:hypothetical protein
MSPNHLAARANEAQKPEYQEWKRGMVHDILAQIFEPLRLAVFDGTLLKCPDGQTRLCFPILATELADYEEMRLLTCIVSGYCPKCTIPSYRKVASRDYELEDSSDTDSEGSSVSEDDSEYQRPPRTATITNQLINRNARSTRSGTTNMNDLLAVKPSKTSRITKAPSRGRLQLPGTSRVCNESANHPSPFNDHPRHQPRTADHVLALRRSYKDDIEGLRKQHGFHPTKPFTDRFFDSDIYNAAAPDVLH